MSRDLEALVLMAGLLRDRDLDTLARAARAVAAARRRELGLAGEIAARRTNLREAPDLETARPGAFEAWLRHARREEARLAAACEAASREEAALRDRARRSFGRAAALEALASRARRRGTEP